MKIILVLNLIFISSTFNSKVPKSFYSLLLGDIREDIVDSALLNLPKRDSVDILKMVTLMKDEKEKNSLTDAESAFFIYKWIANNFDIDCYYMIEKEQSDLELYKSGKGQPLSFSSLFNRICSYLKIRSDSISGYYKAYNTVENYYLHYSEISHIYNYIIIDNNTYLVDPTLGIGYCDNYYYTKSYSDLYFGTKPEFLIKSHFPKDDNFQLLKDVITKEQWSSYVFIGRKFYLSGMKNTVPESENISIRDGKKIIINYDPVKNDIGILYSRMVFANGSIVYLTDKVNNGVYEIVSTEIKYRPRNENPMRIEIYRCNRDDQSCIHKDFLVLYHINDWNW